MLVARGLSAAIVVALGLSIVPGLDWLFQLVYALILGLGAASLRWWPIAIVLLLPLWAWLDYTIEPFDDPRSVDSAGAAALFALLFAVPLGAVAFALGRGLRAFALVLGKRNSPSS